MQLARVIGTCVATRKPESLAGHCLLIVQPLDFDLVATGPVAVAVDTVRANRGELVTIVRSREAANALADPFTPVDCTIVSIVDDLGMAGPDGRRLAWLRDREANA